MTDKEINKLESKAKAVKNGHLSVHYDPQVQIDYWVNVEDEADAKFIAYANPAAIIDLIAELRKARKERDWLAYKLEDELFCSNPPDINHYCSDKCSNCIYGTGKTRAEWLEEAREATSNG